MRKTEHCIDWRKPAADIDAEFTALSIDVERLRGERGTFRILLQEADGVLSTIEPEDTHEAGLLEQLRADIAKALAP